MDPQKLILEILWSRDSIKPNMKEFPWKFDYGCRDGGGTNMKELLWNVAGSCSDEEIRDALKRLVEAGVVTCNYRAMSIEDLIRSKILSYGSSGAPLDGIMELMSPYASEDVVHRTLKRMHDLGDLYSPKTGVYKVV